MSDIRGGSWRQVARRAMDAVDQSGVVSDERKRSLHDLADRADRITHDVTTGGRDIVDTAAAALDNAASALREASATVRDTSADVQHLVRRQTRILAGVGGGIAAALVALTVVEARRPRR
jgi:hypothetical protein